MTVPSTTLRHTYVGSGSAGPFDYDWRIQDKSELQVIKSVDATRLETVLVVDVDYTVANVGNDSGGSVTLTSPLFSGEKLSILPSVRFSQEIDLNNQGGYFPQTLEDALDKLTVALKQVKEVSDRSVKASVAYPDDSNTIAQLLASGAAAADSAYQAASFAVISGGSAQAAAVSASQASQAAADVGEDIFLRSDSDFDDGDTALTLSESPVLEAIVWVYFDGVFQDSSGYGIDTTTITFTSAIPNDVDVVVVKYGKTFITSVSEDLSVTTSSLVNLAVTEPKVANNAIVTRTILNANVTGEKLENSGASAGDYLYPEISVDVKGRVTAAASGRTPPMLTHGTKVAATSGTTIDRAGIPDGVNEIKLMLDDVSTNGGSEMLVQIADEDGFKVTGYRSAVARNNSIAQSNATGFQITHSHISERSETGVCTLTRFEGSAHTWMISGTIMLSTVGGIASPLVHFFSGVATLPKRLTSIRLTTLTGVETFDNGNVNILY